MRVLNCGRDATNQRHGPARVQGRLDDGYDELLALGHEALGWGEGFAATRSQNTPPASAVQR